MTKVFSGLDRIDLFAQEILCQISSGKTETVEKIIEEIRKKNVVHYLYSKYQEDWFLSLDENCPYNIDDWEKKYSEYSYISEVDVFRKWGIRNQNDGLLFLVSLTFELLREVLY